MGENKIFEMRAINDAEKKVVLCQDDVWQLHIPMQFVKNLCINCINNYLDECI